MSNERAPLSPEVAEAVQSVREQIEAARRHHAATGEWPPDPLLDELEEMRLGIMAEHGYDLEKVGRWYLGLEQQGTAQNGNGGNPAIPRRRP